MKKEILLQLSKSYHLLEDVDIILFRRRNFPSLSWFIGKYTFSEHSHVALAYLIDGINVIEYREFQKSRIYPLKKYIESGYVVDIYRAPSFINIPYIDCPPDVDDNGNRPKTESKTVFFNKIVKTKILEEAKSLLGRGYGWGVIVKIIMTICPIIRLFLNKNRIDKTPKHFVCSTFVANLFRKHWLDLNPDINDSFVTPSDISGSSVGALNYQFSINEL